MLGQWTILLRPSVATFKAQPADLSPPFAAIVRSRSRCREFKSLRARHVTKSSVNIFLRPHISAMPRMRGSKQLCSRSPTSLRCFRDAATRTGLLRAKGARKKRMRPFVIAGTSIVFRWVLSPLPKRDRSMTPQLWSSGNVVTILIKMRGKPDRRVPLATKTIPA